jgi:rRNA maturation endonuclease Nob1
MILPWPFGLIAALAVFAVYPLILRNRAIKKMGNMDRGGFFGQGQGFRYICLACSNRFKGAICPRCGSKMKRAEF